MKSDVPASVSREALQEYTQGRLMIETTQKIGILRKWQAELDSLDGLGLKRLGILIEVARLSKRLSWLELAGSVTPAFHPVYLRLLSEGLIPRVSITEAVILMLEQLLNLRREAIVRMLTIDSAASVGPDVGEWYDSNIVDDRSTNPGEWYDSNIVADRSTNPGEWYDRSVVPDRTLGRETDTETTLTESEAVGTGQITSHRTSVGD